MQIKYSKSMITLIYLDFCYYFKHFINILLKYKYTKNNLYQ